MTLLTSWKLDPYTVMRLDSGEGGDDVLKGGHLVCSSHKPLTSSYSPVTKRFQAGLYHYLRLLFFHGQIQHSFFFLPFTQSWFKVKMQRFLLYKGIYLGSFFTLPNQTVSNQWNYQGKNGTSLFDRNIQLSMESKRFICVSTKILITAQQSTCRTRNKNFLGMEWQVLVGLDQPVKRTTSRSGPL